MNSNNNPYPTLTSQPVRPYPGMVPPMMPNQFYNQPSTTQPITLGIPLLPNNTPRMSAQNIPTMPVPPTSQTAHSYVHLPQQQVNHVASPYYTSHNPTQPQNSNIRDHNAHNSGYIELTDSTVPEPAYAPCEMKHEENAMIIDSNMPRIQYPQLSGPMTPSYSSYSQYPSYQVTSYQVSPNPDNSGPIVYDLSLLTGITSREPQLIHCPHCNKHVQTVVGYKTGKGAILSGVFMGCLGGLPLLCSWVPCVLKDFKDAVHYCPVCGEVIGTKKFLVK